MEFICGTQELKEAVLKTSKVINKNTTLGILETILIQTDEAKIKLRGTDLGSTIDTVIEANVVEHGASNIDSKTLLAILDKVKAEDIRMKFDIENEEITITSGTAKFKLLNEKISEKYPDIDTVDKKYFFTIDREEYVKGVALTLFSTSSDAENKPFLTGIDVSIDDSNKITFISTDSQRLSKYETMALEKEADSDRAFTFIIPGYSAKVLQDLAKVPGDPIKVYWSGNIIMCSIDNSDFYCRLIEAKYPDISRVIPKDFNTEITIGKNAFKEVLDRMNIASKENGNRCIIRCDNEKIVFSAETKEHKILIEEEVPCLVSGMNIDKMCIHVQHIIDVLNVVDRECENVEIKIVGSEKAFMIRMKDNDKFTHVLMPIRL